MGNDSGGGESIVGEEVRRVIESSLSRSLAEREERKSSSRGHSSQEKAPMKWN